MQNLLSRVNASTNPKISPRPEYKCFQLQNIPIILKYSNNNSNNLCQNSDHKLQNITSSIQHTTKNMLCYQKLHQKTHTF